MAASDKTTCLLVHGWGMNRRIWQPVLEQLPADIDAIALDLPGHGERSEEAFNSLQALTADLKARCESYKPEGGRLLLVGWSLGALPCLELARQHPERVDGMLLVSTNPCFVSRENWAAGVPAEVFDQFADSLRHDFSGTIRRFLSLQVKGSESGRQILREIREKVLQQARPDQASLDVGLEILKQVDMRDRLSDIRQPVSWALGAQDGLVKMQLANELRELMPGAEIKLYSKAGHAPFLSHTDEFVQQVVQCVQKITVE